VDVYATPGTGFCRAGPCFSACWRREIGRWGVGWFLEALQSLAWVVRLASHEPEVGLGRSLFGPLGGAAKLLLAQSLRGPADSLPSYLAPRYTAPYDLELVLRIGSHEAALSSSESPGGL
jgi:hypothetical protein